jgi:hypothetical protein
MPMFRRWGRQGNVVAVNGDALAALTVPANGLLRLRLLNASASRIYRLALDHPWHLMGLDGHPLPRPTPWGDCLLAPGERAAFLISGTETPGTYTLSSLPYDRGITAMMQGMQGSNGGRHGPWRRQARSRRRQARSRRRQAQWLSLPLGYGDVTVGPTHLRSPWGHDSPAHSAACARRLSGGDCPAGIHL